MAQGIVGPPQDMGPFAPGGGINPRRPMPQGAIVNANQQQGMDTSQEEAMQAIITAVASGQDISQFDPKMLSAAKQYTAMKANELNRMVNSTSLPGNVTREMLRNELQMYEGFTNKLAEDDPQFAAAMDAALIGAGVYAAAKYGPMALAKAKTVGAATYGYGQGAYESTTRGAQAMGSKAADMGKSSYGYGKQAMGALSKGVRRLFKIPV